MKPVPNVTDVKEEQFWNMEYIEVTFEVLKLLRSSEVKEEQFWNMEYIEVTFEVLKPLKLND